MEFLVRFEALMSEGDASEEELRESREVVAMVYERAKAEGRSAQSAFNHGVVAYARWPRELLKVRCPAVILHGHQDSDIKFSHAAALNRDMKGSKLVALEEVGHEMPRRVRNGLAEETFGHLSPG